MHAGLTRPFEVAIMKLLTLFIRICIVLLPFVIIVFRWRVETVTGPGLSFLLRAHLHLFHDFAVIFPYNIHHVLTTLLPHYSTLSLLYCTVSERSVSPVHFCECGVSALSVTRQVKQMQQ